jgi:hypothetical protein
VLEWGHFFFVSTIYSISHYRRGKDKKLRVSLLCCTFLGGHRAALKSPEKSETPGREVHIAERVRALW